MVKGDGPLQTVVIYDKPGATGVVYDTAYTESQMQRGIMAARNHHGSKCNARTVTGYRRMRGETR